MKTLKARVISYASSHPWSAAPQEVLKALTGDHCHKPSQETSERIPRLPSHVHTHLINFSSFLDAQHIKRYISPTLAPAVAHGVMWIKVTWIQIPAPPFLAM